MTSVFSRRRIVTLFVALVTLTALLAGPAQARFKAKRELTVMSQNLYLGASLTPAITATSEAEFFEALNGILFEFTTTNYAVRSGAIANEIAAVGPDLIGLQEVAFWTLTPPVGPPVEVDFLGILQLQLAARGLFYSAVAVSDNADIAAPLPDGTLVRFQDRDVILRNDATEGLVINASDSGTFAAQQVLVTPVGALSFDRGWTSVDGTFEGKKFRFVNTHLETEDFAAVQEAQAAEFLAGPARAAGAVIAVGDFNSAADGSTTSSYGMLSSPRHFDDVWSVNGGAEGDTCCQNSSLTNGTSLLDSRIDLVLLRGPVRAMSADVIGATPLGGGVPNWPSDHAGVVATIRVH
jgi:endonuclease/exonuclease/phosphatase family metal-dependent hydrolase